MALIPTGHDLDTCPQCGSRACLAQAPGPICRHTRRPRDSRGQAPPTPPPPPVQRKNR